MTKLVKKYLDRFDKHLFVPLCCELNKQPKAKLIAIYQEHSRLAATATKGGEGLIASTIAGVARALLERNHHWTPESAPQPAPATSLSA